MTRVAHMLRPYRAAVIRTGLLIVVWTLTVVAGPLIVRYAIDHGLSDHDVAALNGSIVAYLVVAAVAYVVARVQIMAVGRIGEGFLRDLRVRVFNHLQSLSLGFFEREKAGVLVSRMTSDIDSMAELVQFGLLQFISNGLLLVFSLTLLVLMSWKLTIVCLISVPIVAVASVKFQRDSNKAYLTIRDRIGQNLSSLQEGITGVRVIQAFGREQAVGERFNESNRSLYDAHMESVRISVWYLPLVEFAGIATTAAVVGIGGWLVHQGEVSLGTVVAFVLLLTNLFEPVQQLSQLFNTVQAAAAGLNKLFGLLDTKTDLPEKRGAVDLPGHGEIEVGNVWFSYGGAASPSDDADEWVLRDVALTIAPGERLALVGPTGAGKSTLAKLVARFYDPQRGSITFGGVDLRDATLTSLRSRIVVVPQEGFLFNGTIRDNVRIARADATDAEVDAALAVVGADERFGLLPEGYATEVRERGSRLSAGERQLVSLARAALADPAVLVLDEATSSLDPGTEAMVERAMDRLFAGRTVIVIAHRLSTAERADRVGVVDHHDLVELGSHADLVAQGGRYAALYESWAGSAAR
ncbi:MAG TPA: ABC transporter ATP-binding protein [Acidimicrobiales bacterium]|nr:ABC transporter ATP-binding protein [Acidimicrobiales bacterium]